MAARISPPPERKGYLGALLVPGRRLTDYSGVCPKQHRIIGMREFGTIYWSVATSQLLKLPASDFVHSYLPTTLKLSMMSQRSSSYR